MFLEQLQLPSSRSAERLIHDGETGAVFLVARDWFARGALVWIGMKALKSKATFGDALKGSAGIEGFVLLFAYLTKPKATWP